MKKLFSQLSIGSLLLLMAFIGCNSNPKTEKEISQDALTTGIKPDQPAPLSKQKELVTKLVGEYQLESINTDMGANTMVSYYKQKGKWKNLTSTFSDREGIERNANSTELKSLNSMKISVKEDLSISLSCNGKEYFQTPYKENELGYFLKKSPKNYSQFLPDKLEPTTIFIDDYMYIYAIDGLDNSELYELDIPDGGMDAAVLKYNIKKNEFELVLFQGDFTNSSVYIFKK